MKKYYRAYYDNAKLNTNLNKNKRRKTKTTTTERHKKYIPTSAKYLPVDCSSARGTLSCIANKEAITYIIYRAPGADSVVMLIFYT